jgi:hypothetical protein
MKLGRAKERKKYVHAGKRKKQANLCYLVKRNNSMITITPTIMSEKEYIQIHPS